jgi:hypothetical protein
MAETRHGYHADRSTILTMTPPLRYGRRQRVAHIVGPVNRDWLPDAKSSRHHRNGVRSKLELFTMMSTPEPRKHCHSSTCATCHIRLYANAITPNRSASATVFLRPSLIGGNSLHVRLPSSQHEQDCSPTRCAAQTNAVFPAYPSTDPRPP